MEDATGTDPAGSPLHDAQILPHELKPAVMAARKSPSSTKTSADKNKTSPRKNADDEPIAGKVGAEGQGDADGGGQPPAASNRLRWFMLLALPLLVLIAFVAFAPALLVRTSLGSDLLRQVYPGWSGTIRIGSGTANWWSPLELNDVEILDGKSQPLATARSIRVDKRPFDLLLDSSNYGTISLEGPVLHLTAGRDSTNLEEALSPFLPSQPQTGSAAADWKVTVANGNVQLHDALNDRRGQIEKVSLTAVSSRKEPYSLSVLCEGETTFADKQGRIKIDLGWREGGGSGDSATFPAARFKVVTQSLALELAELGLRRIDPGLELSGDLRANVTGEWRAEAAGAFLECDGECSVARFIGTLPGFGRGRALRIPEISLTGRVQTAGHQLQIHNVRLDSSLGGLLVDGAIQPGQLRAALETLDWQQLLPRDDLTISGKLAIAELARLSPQFLQLRDDTRITSGEISWRAESRVQQGRREWDATVQTSRLTAESGGRSIDWERPVQVAFLAHEYGQTAIVDRAECRSDFLNGALEPIDRGVAVNGSLDLNRLMSQLSQVIDLPPQSIAGTVDFQIAHQEPVSGESRLSGRLAGNGIRWLHSSGKGWQEPQIEINLLAVARREGTTVRRIEELRCLLTAGGDRFDITLREPVDYIGTKTAWPLSVDIYGQLASWQQRLAPWIPVSGLDCAGRFRMTTQLQASPSRVSWQELVADAQPLKWHMPGVRIDDPRVQVKSSGDWDGGKRQMDIPQFSWASMHAFLKGEAIQARWPDSPLPVTGFGGGFVANGPAAGTAPEITGRVNLRGSLARLLEWGEFQAPSTATPFDGVIDAALDLAQSGNILSADGKLEVTRLTIGGSSAAGSSSAIGREDRLGLQGKVRLDRKRDLLIVDTLDLSADGLQIKAQGQLSELSGRKVSDLSGTLNYDLARISARLQPLIGADVKAAGNGSREFALRGPLFDELGVPAGQFVSNPPQAASSSARSWSAQLSGHAGAHWDSIQAYGLSAGAAEIKAKLANRQIDLGRISFPLTTGTFSSQPVIALDRTPETLLLPAGTNLSQVDLTPQLCAAWMKYVAPTFADAAEVEGKFSVTLGDSSLPLTDPKAGDVPGTLAINSAQLRNGPLATRILQMAEQLQTLLKRKPGGGSLADPNRQWVRLEKQDVKFHMVNRRVHHEGLTMIVDDMPIRTSGSVGFDDTLSLVAEIPIPDKWLGSDPLVQGLKGQTLRVPISGTLKSPAIDGGVFNDLAGQLARSAGEQLLKDTVGKNLDNVLQKPLEKAGVKPQGKLNDQVNDLLQDPLKGLFGGGKK